jgi:signal transduction histidine kinase
MDIPDSSADLITSYLPEDVTEDVQRIVTTRWLMGILVLIATAFCVHVLRLPLPEVDLYLTGVTILAYNALLTWLIRRKPLRSRSLRWTVDLQIGLDWLAMVFFLHLTGGITSPAIPFFAIHMLLVTILLPGRSAYLYLGLAVALLSLLALLERSGLVPHYNVISVLPSDLYRDLYYIGAQVGFFALASFAIVYLATDIMARLRERERQIGALFEATQAVSSTLSLAEVLERLARNAAHALSMPGAAIRLLEEGGGRLRIAAAYGLSRAYLDKGPVELSRSRLDREALAGRPVIVGDAPRDERIQYPQQVEEEGIRSILVVPISGRRGVLGVLRIYSDKPNSFTPADANFVLAIARQGAAAIENALAYEALQRSEEARAQFVRTVTHELRAPVSGAQSLLRVMLRGLAGELTEQQQDILHRLEVRLDSLMTLINDLLELAATKTAILKEPLVGMPLQPAIQRVVDLLAHEAAEKTVTLTLEVPPEPLIVSATEEGLVRIFSNLIGNGVKYTPAGGQVQVKVARVDSSVEIKVADTGIGIPADELPRLWQEFFRARNAKQSGISGTGLGLSIVKQLVEQFGGTISAESVEGKGSTFTIILPLEK